MPTGNSSFAFEESGDDDVGGSGHRSSVVDVS